MQPSISDGVGWSSWKTAAELLGGKPAKHQAVNTNLLHTDLPQTNGHTSLHMLLMWSAMVCVLVHPDSSR